MRFPLARKSWTPKPAQRSEQLTEDSYVVTHRVEEPGLRLDSFLKDRYRKRSREQLKRAIEEGHITIKREQSPHLLLGKLKPSLQLIPGDEILVVSERKPEPEVSFDYKVIYEDEVLFVINKPSNLPVHPAGRYFFNTLQSHLRAQSKDYFLTHRIDKETSGILVMAKEREACADVIRQFADRQTEKTYLAIAKGLTPEDFTVDLPMRRARSVIELKMAVCTHEEFEAQNAKLAADLAENGPPKNQEAIEIQNALTRFKRLGVYENYSLLECYPKTGRQHQIRVHLDAIGHPIVGDKLYGIPEEVALNFYERKHLSAESMARLILPRHALHAAGIRFRHPMTQKRVEFRSELPNDLQEFLEQQLTSANRVENTAPSAAPKAEAALGTPSLL